MNLIKDDLGLSKTIRNIGRLQEVVLVFARHGFDEFITKEVISKIPYFVLPKSKKQISAWTGSIIKKKIIEKIVFRIILMLKFSYVLNDYFSNKSLSKCNPCFFGC